jgi:hypothetical protein
MSQQLFASRENTVRKADHQPPDEGATQSVDKPNALCLAEQHDARSVDKLATLCLAADQHGASEHVKEAAAVVLRANEEFQCMFRRCEPAMLGRDWALILTFEERMTQLLTDTPEPIVSDSTYVWTIGIFAWAHSKAIAALDMEFAPTSSSIFRVHVLRYVELQEFRIPVLKRMQSFSDLLLAMTSSGQILTKIYDFDGAEKSFEQARSFGAANGMFEAECVSCLGLGNVYKLTNRVDEGLQLLRNAVIAGNLVDNGQLLLDALQHLMRALLSKITTSIGFESTTVSAATAIPFKTVGQLKTFKLETQPDLDILDELERNHILYTSEIKKKSEQDIYTYFEHLDCLYIAASIHKVTNPKRIFSIPIGCAHFFYSNYLPFIMLSLLADIALSPDPFLIPHRLAG